MSSFDKLQARLSQPTPRKTPFSLLAAKDQLPAAQPVDELLTAAVAVPKESARDPSVEDQILNNTSRNFISLAKKSMEGAD